MLRLWAIFPVLCAAIALLLTFLCTFAGTNNDMLEGYDLLVLNTSRIGVSYFKEEASTTTSSASQPTSTGFFSSLVHNATSQIHNLTNEAESAIEADINNALRSLAKDIGLHDFYSVHVLNYCEGFFSPNGTSDRNITGCSNSSSNGFAFNPSEVLQGELNSSSLHVNLTALHWPQAIEDGVHDLRTAFHATFVLYCISIVFIGLALLASAAGIFAHGRISALANIALAWTAMLVLIIVSAVVTYAATKAVQVINKYGADIDVNAARGDKFLALTWTATVLMFLAGVAWSAECFVGRHREKKMPKQYY